MPFEGQTVGQRANLWPDHLLMDLTDFFTRQSCKEVGKIKAPTRTNNGRRLLLLICEGILQILEFMIRNWSGILKLILFGSFGSVELGLWKNIDWIGGSTSFRLAFVVIFENNRILESDLEVRIGWPLTHGRKSGRLNRDFNKTVKTVVYRFTLKQ